MQKKSKFNLKLREFLSVTVLSTLGLIVTTFQIYGSGLKQEIKNSDTSPNEVLGVVSGKDGYRLRYSTTTNGGLLYTGNSLCLSDIGASFGSCGTFITTDTKQKDLDFNPVTSGTTSDWTKNSSSSVVNLPAKAEVLYAELIWGGSYKYLDNDVSSQLDNAVTLKTPNKTVSVKPDPTTAADIATNLTYVRTKEITNIIKEGGSGIYTLGSVPSIMVKNNPYNNFAGYTIAIAYRDSTQPARNLSIFTSSEKVGADELTNTAEVKGFATPTSGAVKGKLFVSSGEGDHMYSGDRMKFGKSPTSLADLSGPNNRVDNFFASQINDGNGNLDTKGTFGNNNQKVGTGNRGAVRQGWDITGVYISNRLTNNQTSAYAQGYSTGDGYVINSLGIQIDVNSAYPELAISLPANPKVCVNDSIDLQMIVTNKGSANSNNTKLSLNNLPKGVKLVDGSISINGTNNPKFPVDLGTLKPGESRTVNFKVNYFEENTATLNVGATVDYNYEMLAGQVITDKLESTQIITKSTTCGQKFPPDAFDDNSSTKQNVSTIVDVLKNDSDSDGNLNPTTLKVINQPTNGQTEIRDGKIVYTPNKDYIGSDKFSYEICDNDKLCDPADVNITINPVYPPVAIDDSQTTAKNVAVTIPVLKNDTDTDSTKDQWVYKITTMPANGKVVFEGENAIYTPNQDYTGTDKFSYEICDNDKLCDTADVTITIPKDKQLLPPLAIDDKTAIFANTPTSINILKNDTDSDGTLDLNTIKITANPENGKVEIKAGEIVYTPNQDYTGTDKFSYEICDNDKLCDTADVVIIIIGDAQKEPVAPVSEPIAARNDSYTTKPDTSVTGAVLSNDEVNTPKTVNLTQLPKNGAVLVNGDLTIKYTPNPGFNGKDTFVYQVCNQGGCASANVDVTVEPRGRVLGDIQNLVRTGGEAIVRLWFFGFAAIIGLGGVFLSLKGSKEKDA